MTQCKECGDKLMSTQFSRCKDCIIEEHKELISDIVQSIEDSKLRELTVVHSEVRKRLSK